MYFIEGRTDLPSEAFGPVGRSVPEFLSKPIATDVFPGGWGRCSGPFDPYSGSANYVNLIGLDKDTFEHKNVKIFLSINVNIFFLPISLSIYFGCSKEPSQ